MPLNAAQPITYPDGTMQAPFRDVVRALENNLPLLGNGSPEGVVNAPLYTLYIDKDGAAGNIEYRKMLADIAGDTAMGWLQV